MHGNTFGVDGHGYRHIDYLEFVYGFHSEVGEAQDTRGFDRPRHEVGGSANSHQVDGAVFANGLDGFRAAFSFADHAEKAGMGEHVTGEGVHARGGGGASGANNFVADWIDGTDVVDEATLEVDGKYFSALKHVGHAFVGGVPTREELAVEQQDFTRLPGGDLFARDGIEIDAASAGDVIRKRWPVFERRGL